jgi:hypothetical protein
MLARAFRIGTPALVALYLVGLVPWWSVLLPVFPMWWSAMTTAHEAHARARVIHRPERQRSLAENAAEQQYLFAVANLGAAAAVQTQALRELTAARAIAKAQQREQPRKAARP